MFVFRDPDAISTKRPLAYIEHEQAEVRRNSSVVSANPEAMKRRVEALDRANKEVEEEKGAEFVEKV